MCDGEKMCVCAAEQMNAGVGEITEATGVNGWDAAVDPAWLGLAYITFI